MTRVQTTPPRPGRKRSRPNKGSQQPPLMARALLTLRKTVEHHLPSRLVEVDGELVAVDGGDGAGAEFLVEAPLAEGEAGIAAGGFRHQLALDEERAPLRAAGAGE